MLLWLFRSVKNQRTYQFVAIKRSLRQPHIPTVDQTYYKAVEDRSVQVQHIRIPRHYVSPVAPLVQYLGK